MESHLIKYEEKRREEVFRNLPIHAPALAVQFWVWDVWFAGHPPGGGSPHCLLELPQIPERETHWCLSHSHPPYHPTGWQHVRLWWWWCRREVPGGAHPSSLHSPHTHTHTQESPHACALWNPIHTHTQFPWFQSPVPHTQTPTMAITLHTHADEKMYLLITPPRSLTSNRQVWEGEEHLICPLPLHKWPLPACKWINRSPDRDFLHCTYRF